MNADNRSEAARPIPVRPAPEPAARETPQPLVEPASPPQPAAAARPAAPAPAAEPKKKSRLRRPLILAVPLILLLGGAYAWLSGGRYEETENANFHQARLLIASDLSGRVTEVGAKDDQPIARGALLFQIDARPYEIALQQAEAAVAAARVQVSQMKSAYDAAVAQRALAQTDVDYVQTNARRQSTLTSRGVSSAASQDQSQHDLQRAQQALTAAEVGVQSAAAALGGDPETPVDQHPLVLQAIAAQEKAAYTLSQTKVVSPVDGMVFQAASFQPGQFVAAGSPLFSVVATEESWVEANFKETQLEALRPGQAAEVTFDTFPDQTFTGTVQAVGAGTGAEFSILPAQNATGNWVKVTQRVPVRVRLADDQDLSLLRSGMSATVSVDTGRETGLERFEGRASAVVSRDRSGAPVTTATTTTAPATR